MGKFENLVRSTAAEGAVLLFNSNQALPLKENEKISVFGRASIDFYRSGTGSGGAVNVAYTTNLIEGLINSEKVKVNTELVSMYRDWIKDNPFDNGGGGWACEPWFQRDCPLTRDMVNEAYKYSKKAVYCIGRTAGEDKDNLLEEGSFLLTKTEKENLILVSEIFDETVIVLNTTNIIDMSFLDELKDNGKIHAILYVFAGGMEGGNAAADVLTGKATPSGKLTDTIADYEYYPSVKNHGGEDENIYEEDIYVGYRYFETFCPEKVRYEFGYGQSYTTFDLDNACWSYDEKNQKFECFVKVINTGKCAGKEVVQVYVGAPQGKLGKPAKVLTAFKKTSLLNPGDEEEIKLEFTLKDFASFDDLGVTGYANSYVLEDGQYDIYLGTSVKKCKKINGIKGESFELIETLEIERLEEALSPLKAFNRIKPGQSEMEAVPTRTYSLKERIESRLPEEIPYTGNKGIQLKDVYDKSVTIEEFIAQLSREDLACIVRGEGMGHPDVTPGTASAFGAVSDSLKDLGIPLCCAADGPSGVRMENGEKAVQLPIGTLLAATWNTDLVQELYTCEGEEVSKNKVDTLLGPGLNIHRNPLNGRNFEYYSEDPLVTGKMASAAAKGLYAGGAFATLKHFAANSQEKRRSFVNAVVSARALREIYLKGFEIAVKAGGVYSVMTSYNPINGYYAASNYDLTTTILRKEWGFEGIVMSDWWAKMNDVNTGETEGSIQNTRDMVRAQNDLFMVVNNYGAEINNNNDNTIEALKKNELTIAELQRSAINICRFAMQTKAFERVDELKKEIKQVEALEIIQVDESNELVNLTMEKTSFIEFKEDSIMTLIARMSSPDSNIHQNTAELVIDGIPLINIQTQGTDGNYINQKLMRLEFKKGIHSIEPKVLKNHLVIESVRFIKK